MSKKRGRKERRHGELYRKQADIRAFQTSQPETMRRLREQAFGKDPVAQGGPQAKPVASQEASRDSRETALAAPRRWNDAIDLVQQLARTCELPGLLAQTWGTHSLASEGLVQPGQAPSRAQKDQAFDRYVREKLPGLFRECEPYFVDKDLLGLIERTAPTVPGEARLKASLFKSKYGCLFYERPVAMPPRRLIDVKGFPTHEPAPLSGFAWQIDNKGAVLVFFFAWYVDHDTPMYFEGTYIGNIPLSVVPWEFESTTLANYIGWHNRSIKDNPDEDDTNNATRFAISARTAVATLLLMDQVLTVINGATLDRHARKRAVRAGWTHEPRVQVVTLRRQEVINPYAEQGGPVEWSCRWRVREHWRTLKRGTPDERTVLVHEHIKGPEGLPIKPPNLRVWNVAR